jgi:hypothetical protein
MKSWFDPGFGASSAAICRFWKQRTLYTEANVNWVSLNGREGINQTVRGHEYGRL